MLCLCGQKGVGRVSTTFSFAVILLPMTALIDGEFWVHWDGNKGGEDRNLR